MTQTNDNTSSHKGKRFFYSEHCQIIALKKVERSNRKIAEILNRASQTLRSREEQLYR